MRQRHPYKGIGLRRKEKPGCHPGGEPDNERHIVHRLGLESNTEDKPEYRDHDKGMDQRPEEAERRADILRTYFPDRHSGYQALSSTEQVKKREETIHMYSK